MIESATGSARADPTGQSSKVDKATAIRKGRSGRMEQEKKEFQCMEMVGLSSVKRGKQDVRHPRAYQRRPWRKNGVQ
jgi:hypothetical protein